MYIRGRFSSLKYGLVFATVALLCPGKTRPQCSNGTMGINYVGTETGKPFMAERIDTAITHQSDGTDKRTIGITEVVARDGTGRIRFEKHGPARPEDHKEVILTSPEGERFAVENVELKRVINIFDCTKGTFTMLQPGMRIAWVKEASASSNVNARSRSFSSLFSTLQGHKLPANIQFQDLGIQMIEGVEAHGFKTTTLGQESDGHKNGLPIKEEEIWVSDDLAVIVLDIRRDMKAGTEFREALTKIKREEPDSSIFEIPEGFRINPKNLPSSGLPDQRVAKPL